MAIADRNYMRDPFNPPRMATRLIVVLLACFVDPILDKIAAQGFGSLTDQERKLLDAARRRIK